MKRLVLNLVTLCADGSIEVRWLKQLVDPDTDEVLHSEPHRTTVDFDGDVDLQVQAASTHLQQMGYPPVDAAMLARIKAIDAVGRADQVIDAVRQRKIIERAIFEAQQRKAEADANH